MDSETKPTFSKSAGLARKQELIVTHLVTLPISPACANFSLHFPIFIEANNEISKKIEFADIRCGFGGLLISIAAVFPDTLMIGMELRDKVTEYVEWILASRRTSSGGQYENIFVVRINSMKYIPQRIEKGQLSKILFLSPDPHFKEKNHKRRVIHTYLLDEYAYVLRAGGIIYTITDVEELGEWMKSCLAIHPTFESLKQEELNSDPVVELLCNATENGKKILRTVSRRKGYVS